MLKVIISGCNGKMGRVVTELCQADPDIEIVAGFTRSGEKLDGFPVYADPMEFGGSADCLIDFSNPAALSSLLAFCVKRNIPPVLATTGYSEVHLEAIRAASTKVAIFKSANMSLGINVLASLVTQAARLLEGGYDIEIVERHHRRKLDAPSGTAVLLADAASAGLSEKPEYVYDRHERRAPRPDNEIGISAVRGGTIVGEHEVIFAGRDEVIELRHSAASREVFATGAVKAAMFIAGKQPGIYDMQMLVKEG